MSKEKMKQCECIHCQKSYSNGYKDGFNEAIKPTIREKILKFEPIITVHPKPLVLPEKKYIDGLEVFLEASGPLHDQDCPCDDTCQCAYKIANDGADICCKFLKQFSIDEVEKLNAGPGIAGIKSC